MNGGIGIHGAAAKPWTAGHFQRYFVGLTAMTDFSVLRTNMVDGQIKPNKVTDVRLLGALADVPREQFVDRQSQCFAYVDEDLPLGDGRHLMEPMVLARLINEAQPKTTDIALDIGCATGYSTAILSRVVETVVGLESNPEMAATATQRLIDLGYDNAVIVEGPLTEGHPPQQPYDVILFGGAVADVPGAILEQLADGGRLVAVERKGLTGQAMLYQRIGDVTSHRPLFDANIPLLPEFQPVMSFEF